MDMEWILNETNRRRLDSGSHKLNKYSLLHDVETSQPRQDLR